MTQRTHHRAPVRTCAGCKGRDEQSKLLRVARVVGGVAVDPRRRLPGRGSYLHRRLACVDRAARPGGLARGLRVEISPEQLADLRRAVERSINE